LTLAISFGYSQEPVASHIEKEGSYVLSQIITWGFIIAGVIIGVIGAIIGISFPFYRIKGKIESKMEILSKRVNDLEENSRRIEDAFSATEKMFYLEENVVIGEEKDKERRIFFRLFEDYKQRKNSFRILKKLKELIEDKKFKNKHRAYYYIGYIYGDKERNRESFNLLKAKEYYKKSLEELDELEYKSDDDIESKRKEFKCIVLNDLAYTEMELAKKENTEERIKFYERAEELLEETIKILGDRHLKWANPYKNKGYCLGKMAILEKNKQTKLFIEALSMYQIAFSLYANATNKDDLHKSYNETMSDFVEWITLPTPITSCESRSRA
jgi:tetratricopeptide (TPR) repeat protein